MINSTYFRRRPFRFPYDRGILFTVNGMDRLKRRFPESHTERLSYPESQADFSYADEKAVKAIVLLPIEFS